MRELLRLLALLTPALIPSWRFFEEIAPSPRIEYRLPAPSDGAPDAWREFRPRPQTLSPLEMLRRLLWNPRWNESLFLVSLAERLLAHPTEHSRQEILTRLRDDLARTAPDSPPPAALQFRITVVHRDGGALRRDVVYVSPLEPLAEGAAPWR